jgi:hypothetical protein
MYLYVQIYLCKEKCHWWLQIRLHMACKNYFLIISTDNDRLPNVTLTFLWMYGSQFFIWIELSWHHIKFDIKNKITNRTTYICSFQTLFIVTVLRSVVKLRGNLWRTYKHSQFWEQKTVRVFLLRFQEVCWRLFRIPHEQKDRYSNYRAHQVGNSPFLSIKTTPAWFFVLWTYV